MKSNKNIAKLATIGVVTIASAVFGQSAYANTEDTTVTKVDNQIVVENPEVKMDKQSMPTWDNAQVTYQTEIPDDVEINAGDQIKYDLPQELKFSTDQQFDVYNQDASEVVGNAKTDLANNNVVTTFNDYFQRNPLNKEFTLNLNVQFNKETVTERTKYDLNFNGKVIRNTEVEDSGQPNKDEILAKWGWQTEDPNVIQWGGRVNFVQNKLVDVEVSDTWDSNQEYVPNSLRFYYLTSVTPWTQVGTERSDIVEHRKNGFSFKLPKLNYILAFEYKTRVKNKNIDAYNSISMKAYGQEYTFDRTVEMLNGSGMAKGEKRPVVTFVPGNPPVVEIPEWNGGVVPLDPPTVDKPEWNGGVVPNDPPVHELPEWNGGVVPLDPPIHDKPEFEGGVVPLDPPVVEIPEAEVPVPSKPGTFPIPFPEDGGEKEKPKKEVPAPQPQPEPKKEEVKESVVIKAQKAELPKTGAKESLLASLFGLAIMAGVAFFTLKKKN